MAADMKATLRQQSERKRPYWGLTADIKGAHQLVAVRPEDWPLIACQLEAGGDVFLNKVGAFGGSSVFYWWSRLVAAAHRTGLLVVYPEWPLWALLFADDLELSAEGPTYCHAILCFLWWLVVLGFPCSWLKTHGGFTYS